MRLSRSLGRIVGTALDSRLLAQRLIRTLRDIGGDRQARVAPAFYYELSAGATRAAETATHVGEIGIANLLEHLARALRASARHASDHELLALGQELLGDQQELGVDLELAGPLDEHDREIDRALGMALGEFVLGPDVNVHGVGILAEDLVSLRRLGLSYRHRRIPLAT